VIVIHREYISDLLASATAGAFSALGFPINPGNSKMFPWLSEMAKNFESYVFKSLKFFFETDVASTTPGTVLLAVDYDPLEPVPQNKRDLMSYRGAVRTVPWEAVVCTCDKEDLHKRSTYYVSSDSGSAPGFTELDSAFPIAGASKLDADLRLDDVGTLIAASSNANSNSALGELYVEYEVLLETPQVGGAITPYFSFAAANTANNNEIGAGGTIPFGDKSSIEITTRDDPTGAAPYRIVWDTLGCRFVLVGNSTFIEWLNTGTYWLEICHQDVGATATNQMTGTMTAASAGTTVQESHVLTKASNTARVDYVRTSYIVVDGPVHKSGFDGNPIAGSVEWDISVTGLAFNPAGAGYSTFVRCVQIPDWGADASGVFPRPGRLGSVFRHRRSGKKFYPSLSQLESRSSSCSCLAGNASPLDKEEKSPSSSDEMVPCSCEHCPRCERSVPKGM
jgi:hypothetical protein